MAMTIFQLDHVFFDQLAGVERKKYVHEIKIIKYLYISGPHSLADICKHLKISAPNAISMLNDLADKNFIEKKGRGVSIGGRKPDLYGVQVDCFYVMAVEIGLYKTRMAIYNSMNENLTGVKDFFVTIDNNAETIDAIITAIQQFIEQSGVNIQRLTGIGISMPGLVDSIKGINHTYFKFGEKHLLDLLKEKLQKPVFIENDAKAIALAEYLLRLEKSKKDMLVLNLDWGIGLGMILNGKLYQGVSGFAGEFGHISMLEDGQLCRCGKLGCLETVASGTTIVQMAEEGIASGKSSILLNKKNARHTKIDVKDVVDAALSGDQYAIGIFAEVGKNLGKGLSILIQLFNPELIVLSGRMAEAGQYLMTPIQQSVQTHTMNQLNRETRIELSELGQNIGMMGALAVVKDHIFETFIKRAV